MQVTVRGDSFYRIDINAIISIEKHPYYEYQGTINFKWDRRRWRWWQWYGCRIRNRNFVRWWRRTTKWRRVRTRGWWWGFWELWWQVFDFFTILIQVYFKAFIWAGQQLPWGWFGLVGTIWGEGVRKIKKVSWNYLFVYFFKEVRKIHFRHSQKHDDMWVF